MMRQTLGRFARLTAGYSLVSLAGPVATVLLTPLYTRVLSPADYGMVDVTLTLGALVGMFVSLGMDQALSAFFFEGGDAHRRTLVTTASLYVGAAGMLAGAGLALLAAPIAGALFHDPARDTLFLLLSINVVCAPVYGLLSAALRLRMGVRRVNALGLAYLLTLVTSSVILVLGLQLKAAGVVAANVITNTVACGVGLWLAAPAFRGRASLPLLRKLLPVGVALLPGAISGLLFQSADRLLLTQYVPQQDIGLYSIANKLGSMLVVVMGPAMSAWWPIALEMAGQPDAPRQYARMFEYLVAASVMLALAFGLFARDILAIFTREAYLPAAPYAVVLLAYYGPLSIMTYCCHIGLFAAKRTSLVSLASVIAATANVALNLLLAPAIGVWGAVGATLLSAGVLFAVNYRFSQGVFPVRYRWGRIGALCAIYAGIIAAFLAVPALDTTGFKLAAIAAGAASVFAVGILTTGQVRHAAHSLWLHMERLRYKA